MKTFFVTEYSYGQQKNQDINFYGRWKVFKCSAADSRFGFDKKESEKYLNKEIIITPDKIYSFADTCSLPNYTHSTVIAFNYFEQDTSFIKMIGCKNNDNIEVVKTKCGTPFIELDFLTQNLFIGAVNNLLLFFERIPPTKNDYNKR